MCEKDSFVVSKLEPQFTERPLGCRNICPWGCLEHLESALTHHKYCDRLLFKNIARCDLFPFSFLLTSSKI